MRHTAGCGNVFSASWSEKGKAGPALLDPTDSQGKWRQGVSLNENENNDCYSYYWANTVTPVFAWLPWHPVSFRVNLNIILIVFWILIRLAWHNCICLVLLMSTLLSELWGLLISWLKKIELVELFQLLPWVSWISFFFSLDLPKRFLFFFTQFLLSGL